MQQMQLMKMQVMQLPLSSPIQKGVKNITFYETAFASALQQ